MKPQDLELIAALVEGRLEGEERDEALARIERDEALYEVYAETLRELEQESSSGVAEDEVAEEGAEIVAFPRPLLRRFRSVAVAALVILAVGAGLWFNLYPFTERVGSLAAVAGRSGELPSGWTGHDWSVMRGEGAIGETAVGLRAGVLGADLRAAAAAADVRAIRSVLLQLRSLLQEVPLAQPALAALREASENDDLSSLEVEPLLRAVRAAVDEEAFRLGEWVAAARLLAAAGLDGRLERLPDLPLGEALRVRLSPAQRETLARIESDTAELTLESLEAAIREF